MPSFSISYPDQIKFPHFCIPHSQRGDRGWKEAQRQGEDMLASNIMMFDALDLLRTLLKTRRDCQADPKLILSDSIQICTINRQHPWSVEFCSLPREKQVWILRNASSFEFWYPFLFSFQSADFKGRRGRKSQHIRKCSPFLEYLQLKRVFSRSPKESFSLSCSSSELYNRVVERELLPGHCFFLPQ
jgi:hypothetical protein